MKFIRPILSTVGTPKYKDHINEIINLDRVVTLTASRTSYYPDNHGIPVIRFWFGDKDFHEWYFDKGEEARRDDLISYLVKIQNVKNNSNPSPPEEW